MTQEEKELLLKDLCARLPYGVIMNTPNGDGHLCSINQTIFGNEYGINISATRRDYFNDEKLNFKPYLRPMSSMTEEEVEELFVIIHKKTQILAIKENGLLVGNVPFIKDDSEVKDSAYNQTFDRIACWSLSALINIIEIGKVEICFNYNSNKYWLNVHFETLGSFCQDHELYDSKIDALIAIIKKLKK